LLSYRGAAYTKAHRPVRLAGSRFSTECTTWSAV
jgi:hypothetical protein